MPTGTGTLVESRDSEETFRDVDVEDGLLKNLYKDTSPVRTNFRDSLCSCGGREKPERRLGAILSTLRVLVVFFAIWGAADMALKLRKPLSNRWLPPSEVDLTCYCGNSTAEAKAMGCKYDSLAQAWLPDHCRDDELLAEFEASGPNDGGGWSFYRDWNHSIPMTYEEVSLLGDTGEQWYTEWDWHAAHCMYYWKKQWRSWHRYGHELYETATGPYDHIAHCENAIRWTSIGTKGWVHVGG